MERRYTVWEKVSAWRQGVIYGTGETLEECDEDAKRQFDEDDYYTELDFETMQWTGDVQLLRDGGTYDGVRVEPKTIYER